jgi:hypothetical protein
MGKGSRMATTGIAYGEIAYGNKIVADLAAALKHIPEVVDAYYSFGDGVFSSWIVVDPYELNVRRAVFEVQQSILDRNRDIEFDFYTVAASNEDDPNKPLFSDASIAYSRKR